MKKISRRRFMKETMVVGTGMMTIPAFISYEAKANQWENRPADKIVKADIILRNGSVYTVDDNRNIFESIAVKGEKIIFVGTSQEADKYTGNDTKIIQLDGKMVLPGFIDSHMHASLAIDKQSVIGLHSLDSLEAIQQTVSEFSKNHPEFDAIYGFGWQTTIFPEWGPTKEDLDAVISDRPAILTSWDGHSAWYNSLALEIAGISKDMKCPMGGVIEINPKTGEIGGTFRENARDLVQNALPPLSIEQQKNCIREAMNHAANVGITTVHDPLLILPNADGQLNGFGYLRNNILAYEQMAKDRSLTFRVRGSVLTDPDKGGTQVINILHACRKQENRLFGINGVKVFIDGAGDHILMIDPFLHKPHSQGESLWEQNSLNELFIASDKGKLQIHVHAIGDGATRMALNAFRAAMKQNGSRDSRHQITHLVFVDPTDIPQFAELGILGIPQPIWFMKEETSWNRILEFVGNERASRLFPMKSFIETGTTMASSSDYPVQVPSPPLTGIQLGVTRCAPWATGPDMILGPDERVSLEEMIASFTINGAKANFLEDETGSIEVGKKADLVVLKKNLFDIPPTEIAETKVLMTIFEGKIVHNTMNDSMSST
jgi:predicted amidohydrolase YtcJ